MLKVQYQQKERKQSGDVLTKFSVFGRDIFCHEDACTLHKDAYAKSYSSESKPQ